MHLKVRCSFNFLTLFFSRQAKLSMAACHTMSLFCHPVKESMVFTILDHLKSTLVTSPHGHNIWAALLSPANSSKLKLTVIFVFVLEGGAAEEKEV